MFCFHQTTISWLENYSVRKKHWTEIFCFWGKDSTWTGHGKRMSAPHSPESYTTQLIMQRNCYPFGSSKCLEISLSKDHFSWVNALGCVLEHDPFCEQEARETLSRSGGASGWDSRLKEGILLWMWQSWKLFLSEGLSAETAPTSSCCVKDTKGITGFPFRSDLGSAPSSMPCLLCGEGKWTIS